MRAVILAAGIGKRLQKYTKDKPKCMVEIDGITIIERLLRQIIQYGKLRHIVIVVGYLGDVLENYIKKLNLPSDVVIDFIYNDKYYYANNIYSLYSAKQYFNDDIMLFESDLVFDDLVIKQIFDSKFENFVLVSHNEPWMDGTVVTIDAHHRVKKIIFKEEFDFKQIDKYYKTANIYKFSKSFLENLYLPILENYIDKDNIEFYYERALKDVVNNGVLNIEIVESDLWYEIDNPNDFSISKIMFSDFSKHYEMLKEHYGGYWRFSKIKDYCYLVNPYFPTTNLLEELGLMLSALVVNYPSGLKVVQRLAGTLFGVDERFLLVGNGASELIRALMLVQDRNIGVIVPTFEEYINCANNISFFTIKNDKLTYRAREIIKFILKESLQTIILISPDNPSGFLLPKEDIEEILNWTKARNINVVLDESFIDFADEKHYYTFLTEEKLALYPNLILIKSISKSYGVAGIRLGILASSNATILKEIQDKCSIWNINSIAEYFLQAIVKYKKEYKKSCERLVKTRKIFVKELKEIEQIKVFDSQSNYVLCSIKDERISVEELAIFCLKNNFLIKDCSNKIGLNGGRFFRLAIKEESLNSKLVLTIKNFFKSKVCK
ncbi:aminotransferase class I/II-fold pyridoxal phosphate-dependent enzyme [Helicobacter turcicus]|uniref:Aminotransferase n=1 Tax=Helicobacter turcicus TaxID=2867412 RepID=A0ABS7JQ00_9HELI|nr:aminotransferase class I/II-fold pyridoxal phosphate-dependent enzyme [Helicobacter turcicus]MBX7491485.1 aminotransferase class I/II-fold pyridoxal phosphate-dependent enzyme [Helicobacter turcicus]MBX7546341.1 aminotransferase class I/II-fold pyridoxal phosphate-dependent enzyme [Helicobacter turcicus]